MVSCGGLLPGAGPPEERTVTWFQFHSYLQRHSVSDLEKHFVQLTKEGRGWAGGGLQATPEERRDTRPWSPRSWLSGSRFLRATAPFPSGCSLENPDLMRSHVVQ